jgi:hypothetical protein
MTSHITVWTLAWDTREGTNCKVFATEKELDSHVEQIMRDDLSATTGDDAEAILALLNSGQVWDAWERWCEKCKDALDTYNWDFQPLDVTID